MEGFTREERTPESPADVERDEPLRRFRLGRYVLMLLFAFTAVAYVAPAVTGVVVAIDSAAEEKVDLKRLTEGGTPVGGAEVTYATFLLIVAVSVGLVAAAAVAAYFFLGDRPRATAWTVLVIVGVLGVAGALIALAIGAAEVGMYLASIAVCFALLVAAGLFELWRARWLESRPAAPSPAASRPA
jgi:hypothetical protein